MTSKTRIKGAWAAYCKEVVDDLFAAANSKGATLLTKDDLRAVFYEAHKYCIETVTNAKTDDQQDTMLMMYDEYQKAAIEDEKLP